MTEYLLLTKRAHTNRAFGGWIATAYIKADEPPRDWTVICEAEVASGGYEEYKIINLTLDHVVTAR